MKIELDRLYSDKHIDRRVMDWFIPEAPNGDGILFIHGGGWSGGNKESWHEVAEHFSVLGYTCASAEYRLIPQTDFDGQFTDVRLAAAAFRGRAGELGYDENRIAAVGSSAGGHLVAMLGTLHAADKLGSSPGINGELSRINAAVCYCPVTAVYDTATIPGFFTDTVRSMLGGEYTDNPELFHLTTPVDRIDGTEPPFLFMHGDEDELVDLHHSTEMHRKLLESGGESRLVVIPGAPHGFGYGVTTEFQKLGLRHIKLFLKKNSSIKT